MKEVKIGIQKWLPTHMTSEITIEGTIQVLSFYQLWHFKLTIADSETNEPVKNLKKEDFKINFLFNAHTEKFFQISLDVISGNISNAGVLWFITIKQLTMRTLGGIVAGNEIYPADWFEVILKSTTANASGVALFYLH
jgi:hypothetical protein